MLRAATTCRCPQVSAVAAVRNGAHSALVISSGKSLFCASVHKTALAASPIELTRALFTDPTAQLSKRVKFRIRSPLHWERHSVSQQVSESDSGQHRFTCEHRKPAARAIASRGQRISSARQPYDAFRVMMTSDQLLGGRSCAL